MFLTDRGDSVTEVMVEYVIILYLTNLLIFSYLKLNYLVIKLNYYFLIAI